MTRESSTLTRIPSAEIWTWARAIKPTQRRMWKSCLVELVMALKQGGVRTSGMLIVRQGAPGLMPRECVGRWWGGLRWLRINAL